MGSERLAPSTVRAAYQHLTELVWGGAGATGTELPPAEAYASGRIRTGFLVQDGHLVAMTSVVRTETPDGPVTKLRNTASMPAGAALADAVRVDARRPPSSGRYRGGGSLTVMALALDLLEERRTTDPELFIHVGPRLSRVEGIEGAARHAQRTAQQCGLCFFDLGKLLPYAGRPPFQLIPACHLPVPSPELLTRPVYVPDVAGQQAHFIRTTFALAFGAPPPVLDTPVGAPAPTELIHVSASPRERWFWVSSPGVVGPLAEQARRALSAGPSQVVYFMVRNHADNIPLMRSLEAWGAIPLGSRPSFGERAHRLIWGLGSPEVRAQVPELELHPSLLRSPIGPLIEAAAQGWRRMSPSLPEAPAYEDEELAG